MIYGIRLRIYYIKYIFVKLFHFIIYIYIYKMNEITIIGFGISTLSFLLYLIDNNLINNFKNILILEKNSTICQNSLKYININSNSTLRSLLSIFTNSIFKNTLDKINKNYEMDKFINLFEFNKLITLLALDFKNHIKKYDNLKLQFNFTVNKI